MFVRNSPTGKYLQFSFFPILFCFFIFTAFSIFSPFHTYCEEIPLILPHWPDKTDIYQLNPRPNLTIEESTQTIAIELSNKIEDTIENKDAKTTMTGWRGTLQRGFRNGFKGYFKVVENPKEAELVLKILRCDLKIWFGDPGHQIIYQSKLVNSNGETVGMSANTITHKLPIIVQSQRSIPDTIYHLLADDMTKSSVEVMYETISKDIFHQ